jgi:hypothetical protein
MRREPENRAQWVARSPEDRREEPRHWRLEYFLLALIALGVSITIAMAIIDPGA